MRVQRKALGLCPAFKGVKEIVGLRGLGQQFGKGHGLPILYSFRSSRNEGQFDGTAHMASSAGTAAARQASGPHDLNRGAASFRCVLTEEHFANPASPITPLDKARFTTR